MTWTNVMELNIGDTFTIGGQYKRRSFIQWLKREPKQLVLYTIKEHTEAFTQYEPAPKD